MKTKAVDNILELTFDDFPYERLNIYDLQGLLFSWGEEFRVEIEDLRLLFQLIDLNQVGHIGYKDLRRFFILYGQVVG